MCVLGPCCCISLLSFDRLVTLFYCHMFLCADGQLIILEAVLQPDRVKPFNAVVIDIGMLSFLRGRGRSSDDYKALIEQAGFTDFSFHPTQGSSNYDVITARKV